MQSLEKARNILLALVACIVVVACRDEVKSVVEHDTDPETTPTMTTDSVYTLVSDSGITKYRITAQLWLMYEEAKKPFWRFPQGLMLEQFDSVFNVAASIICDSATYFKDDQLWRLDGNVNIETARNELILTNNGFAFGQDWKCSVDFSDMSVAGETMEYPNPEADLQAEEVEESLAFYFQKSAQEKYQRTVLEEAYQQAYENLPEFQKGQVVSAVSPVLPGNRIQSEMCLTVQDPPEGVIWDERISPEKQYELMGLNWSTYDSFGRLIGAQGEYAMVLSVQVPLQDYADGTRELPLFYVMVYDREETQKDDACAFIHGQTVSFEDLEERKVFEDEKYAAYDVSDYVYGDGESYLQAFFRQNPDVAQNAQTLGRIQNFYTYYQDHLQESVLYLQDAQQK